MSSPNGKRDVVQLRTFASDVERVRTEKGLSAAETTVSAAPATPEVPDSGVFLKLKKRSLELKEEAPKNNAADTDGVIFDEETTSKVSDKAYEEHKTIKDSLNKKDDTIQIRTGDTLGVLASSQKTAPSTATMPPIVTPKPLPTPAPTPSLARPIIKPPVTSIKLEAKETIDKISAAGDANANTAGVFQEITDSEVGRGEIVTDRKRDRFKLFPAMGEAIVSWVDDTKNQIKENQREKHTVSAIENRVDTIRAAAQEKTLAPEADFIEVAERIKQTKKNPAQETPIIFKPKSEEAPVGWTHVIPDNLDANTAPVVPPPAVAPAERPTVASEATPTMPVSTPEVTQQPVMSVSAPEKIETPAPVVPMVEIAPPIISPIEAVPKVTPEPTHQPEPIITPVANSALSQLTEKLIDKDPPATRTPAPVANEPVPFNTPATREFLPSPLVAIVVVILAIISGIGTSMYFFWQPAEETVVEPETSTLSTVRPLFTAQLQTDVEFSESHSTTMNTLLAAVQSESGTLHIYLTKTGSEEIMPAAEVMRFLAPQAPGSFVRSVTEVNFGGYSNQPFVILKVNNFDNAFAGMLAWEQTISADLAPLFGPVVTETFDPLARTVRQTRSPYFKDVIANNLSGRLLSNHNNEDSIIYTFIDKQTILITTNRLQLGDVLPLIR